MRFLPLLFVAILLFLMGFAACQSQTSLSPSAADFPDDPPPPRQLDTQVEDTQVDTLVGKAFVYGEEQARFGEWGYGLPYDILGLYTENLVMSNSQPFFLRATDLQLDPEITVKACAPGGLVHQTGWIYHNTTNTWEQFSFIQNRHQAGMIKKKAQDGAVVDSAWIENCAQATLSFDDRSFLALGDATNYVLAYVCFPTGDPYKPWKCGCNQAGEDLCRRWTMQSFKACPAHHVRIDGTCTDISGCPLGALHETIDGPREGMPPVSFSLRTVPHQFSIKEITADLAATLVTDFEQTAGLHRGESYSFLDRNVITLLDITAPHDGVPGSAEFFYNDAAFVGSLDELESCVINLDKIGVCGDGTQGPLEECDDRNGIDGDGCSASCKIEEPAKVCITDFAGVPDQRTICTPKTGVPGIDVVLSVCSDTDSFTVIEQACLAIDDTECAARNTIVCPAGQRCNEGICILG